MRRELADEKQPKAQPHQRPDWLEADAQALRALMRGEATAHQQKRALDFIINEVAATYDMSYRPGDPTATAFAEGKRFVGHTIVFLLKTDQTTTNNDKISTRELTDDRPSTED